MAFLTKIQSGLMQPFAKEVIMNLLPVS
ncbi:protein of unknown function [Streptococcus thermophilus]|nr:protein of unknown function [Streptococcus thermophilus]